MSLGLSLSKSVLFGTNGVNKSIMKTKSQRRNWWNSLRPEEQDKFISKKAAERTKRNIKKNEKLMEKLKLSFDCKKCIHGIINSCTDRPKGGCVYFADEVNEVYGPKVA